MVNISRFDSCVLLVLEWFRVLVSDVEAALMPQGEGAMEGEHVYPVEAPVKEVTRHIQIRVARLQSDDTRIRSVEE